MRRHAVIRYHGGKARLAQWIISHFAPHRVYVEPYCGAASILMAKPRAYGEVINDLSDDIVNLFRVLRDPETACQLETKLRMTPYARTEFEAAYSTEYGGGNCAMIEQARRLIVRSYMGFGSSSHNRLHQTGFRSNANRNGTTPAHDWVNYPEHVARFTERLQGVVIENRPAVEIIKQHDALETLFFCDPPYVRSTRKSIRWNCEYDRNYEFEMMDDDHREMAACLQEVKGMVVLCGYQSELYEQLFAGWIRVDKGTHADGAVDRTESLWFNPAAAAKLPQGTLMMEDAAI